jgi:hypothetical protein
VIDYSKTDADFDDNMDSFNENIEAAFGQYSVKH